MKSLYTVPKIMVGLVLTYIFLSFIIRPGYLYIFKPTSLILLGDTRLIPTNYTDMTPFFWIIFSQVAGFTVGFLGSKIFGLRQKIGRVTSNEFETSYNRESINTYELQRGLYVLCFLGWIGKIAALLGQVSISLAFTPLGTLGICWLLSGLKQESKSLNKITIILALFHIFFVIIVVHSKFEIYSLFLALIIRIYHFKFQKRKLLIAALSFLGIILFPTLQRLKSIYTNDHASSILNDGTSSNFHQSGGFIIGFLERFDGFSAIVDAKSAGVGSWMPFETYIKSFILNLIPKGPFYRDPLTIGQHWAQEVRIHSFPFVNPKLSLASGPGAEGYLFFGLVGAFAFSLFFGFLIRKLIYGYNTKNLFKITLAISTIFSINPVENGLLGLAGTINKGLQAGIILWLSCKIIEGIHPIFYKQMQKRVLEE